MEKIEKVFVRQFSKEHCPEERKRVSSEVKGKRKEYFDYNKDLNRRIKELTAETEIKSRDVSKITQDIEVIDEEMQRRQQTKILEIVNYFILKKLRQKKEGAVLEKEKFSSDLETTFNLFKELKRQAEDKHLLEEAKKIVDEFYEGQSEAWNEFKREEELSRVENASRNYDVLFIHATNPYGTPLENSLVKNNVGWKTKLQILFALEPTISASTIKEGDGRNNMWAHLGVILGGGKIKGAHREDYGTKAFSRQQRYRPHIEQKRKVSEQINDAVKNRKGFNYNELIVEAPRAGGFYVCLDDPADSYNPTEIIKAVQEFNLPLYILKGGKVFQANYDIDEKEISVGAEIKISQIPLQIIEISDLKKRELLEELFIRQPFRPVFRDAFYLNRRNFGAFTYIEINALQNPANFSGPKYQEYSWLTENKGDMEIIYEANYSDYFTGNKMQAQYLKTSDGRIFQRVKDLDEDREHLFFKTFDEHSYKNGFVSDGHGGFRLKYPVLNNEQYLFGMEQATQETVKSIDNIKKQSQKCKADLDLLAMDEDFIKRAAFHLYGFGEEAEKHGEQDVKDKSFFLADKILPKEEYDELLKKRIDAQGYFKIAKEDLGIK